MAVFNPQIQTTPDRDYTRVTQPISQPLADESGKSVPIRDQSGSAFISSVADMIPRDVEAANKIAEDTIGKDVRNTVEPIREDFTNQLLAVRQQQLGVVPAAVQTGSGSTATDILPQGQSSVSPPTAVTNGLQKVAGIQNFLDSGKANDTYYDMRLKTAVTDLRAKYPGYVDFIDSKVSQITGVNPANATVQNLMSDINRLQTTKKTEYDKAIDDAMKSGYDDAQLWVQKLQADPSPQTLSDYRQWYATQTMHDSNLKRQDAERKNFQGKKEDLVDQRKSAFNNVLASNMSTDFDKVTTIAGMNAQKVLDVMQDAAANPGKYDDAQLRQLGVMISAMKANFVAKSQAQARAISKDNNGNSYSYYGDIGNSAVDASIESQAKVYDNIADALIKGGVNGIGVAYGQAIHAKAVLDGGTDRLVSDKDLGQDAVNMSTMNTLFGPNWTALTIQSGLKNDLDKRVNAFLSVRSKQARLGFDDKGNPVSLTQQVDEAKALEDQGKLTSAMRARYTNNLVNLVDDIKNKDAPQAAKENIVKYIFSPEGQGILNRFKTDYTDPTTGKQVPGKYSVFARLTSQDVVDEVKKMQPQYQQMYQNYLEREAGAELFQKEFLNLNHFTGHDNLHFKYNDGNGSRPPTVELINDKGALESPVGKDSRTYNQRPPEASYIMQVNKITNRVNDALAGMYRVEKAFGKDVNEYTLDFLVNKARVDLGKNWEGLPAKLIDALAASRAPARRIEDTFGNLNSGTKK